MTTTSSVTVFGGHGWSNPAPGIWEAEAGPHTVDGRPPFEASAIAHTDTSSSTGAWRWFLHRPESDEPRADLIEIANGHGRTLADAQRQAEHAARRWRDHPVAPAPLDDIGLSTLVTCSKCGSGYTVTELAANDGRCVTPDDLPFCDSQIFDGYHGTALIEAALR